MRQIISAQDSVLSKELLTSSLLQNLWLEIFENTDISYQEEHKDHSTASQARLQLMLQFIHLNYSRSISLDDIAEQAMVSKSTALNLFRKYLHITPVNYLINYRLKQAGQLLSKPRKKSVSFLLRQDFITLTIFADYSKTLPINPNGIPETEKPLIGTALHFRLPSAGFWSMPPTTR